MGLKQLGDRLVRFVGGNTGMWRVLSIRSVQGDGLPQAERVAVRRGDEPSSLEYPWALSGVISNIRYVDRFSSKSGENHHDSKPSRLVGNTTLQLLTEGLQAFTEVRLVVRMCDELNIANREIFARI